MTSRSHPGLRRSLSYKKNRRIEELEKQLRHEKMRSEARPKVVRHHPSLESLLKRNRSYRGYDAARPVSREELLGLLEVAPWPITARTAPTSSPNSP